MRDQESGQLQNVQKLLIFVITYNKTEDIHERGGKLFVITAVCY